MSEYSVSDWSRQQLRLAFFDFSVRGLGASHIVRAVLAEWERLGALTASQVSYWSDAVDWRDSGGSLPGWQHPAHLPGVSVRPPATEEELWEFVAWRAERRDLARV